MTGFDIKKIRSLAEKNFEQAWIEGGKLIKKEGRVFNLTPKGKSHPLYQLIERVRKSMVELGFTEVVVPMLVDKREVYAQYGNEAPVILDRVFFLAGLERPDIGIGKNKLQQIEKVVPGFKQVDKLQEIFRNYKKNKIAADDLVEVMTVELGLEEEEAGKILSLFSELKELKPVPMDMTLRSHTTAGWFGLLKELQHREPLPLQLFTVGPKFRREQKLDESHLYESWTASVVIMAKDMTLEDGEHITKQIFSKLGLADVQFSMKKATSRYYAPGTEFEIFLKHPKTGKSLEVGNAGFYSPVALSNYDIPNPVFNLGVGLERLLMIETDESDIRALVFPHLYKTAEFSDEELAGMIRLERAPQSEEGEKMADAIVKTAEKNAKEPSPCEFKAFQGEILGKKIVVKVVEPESKTKLVGPAGFNEVKVHQGNVVGVPPKGWKDDEFLKVVREEGISTGMDFMHAFAALAVAEIERAAKEKKRTIMVQVKNVKAPSDINLMIDEVAQRYITANKKRIDIRGPFFTTVVAEFS
jgi:O-phosphoseryl-tRNA synthetase